MATVFLAEDLKHHRPVAIKVLHADLTAALGAERFLREIEIAARLQHPHILPLYDSGAATGFLYYVMPYVEGESLRDRLTREKQLPQDDALRIATEVAGALEAASLRARAKRPADRDPTTALFAEALNTRSAATGAVRRATLAGARAPRAFWRRAVPAAGAVALVATAVALFARRHATPGLGSAGALDPRHVAVLYFEDLSPEKNLAYLADGLTEALIGELSRVAGLDVVSKNGVAPYRNPEIPRDSIGRALGAGTLVQGGVEHVGDRYRVSVRLIEGGSGADFRRASFEQTRGDFLKIPDRLAVKVADFLRERHREQVRLRAGRAGPNHR